MSKPDADDRARLEFFRLGVHYYVAGRFAGLTGLFPMAGNLLHHTVEMFLKGALVRIVGLDKLRNISHDLNAVWREFTTHFAIPDASDFGNAISELHRFERIRYPDKSTHEGMEATFAIYRSHRVEISGPGKPSPRYFLVLEDVDALGSRSATSPQQAARLLNLRVVCGKIVSAEQRGMPR